MCVFFIRLMWGGRGGSLGHCVLSVLTNTHGCCGVMRCVVGHCVCLCQHARMLWGDEMCGGALCFVCAHTHGHGHRCKCARPPWRRHTLFSTSARDLVFSNGSNSVAGVQLPATMTTAQPTSCRYATPLTSIRACRCVCVCVCVRACVCV
jgi:hypothetical protein